MAKTIKLDPGVKRYTFVDDEGNVYSSFHINPGDFKLWARFKEVQEFFAGADLTLKTGEPEELARLEDVVQEQMNKVLGYDCTEEAFGIVGACTPMPDGSAFFEHILNIINEDVPKELESRIKKSEERVERYTKAYEDEGL